MVESRVELVDPDLTHVAWLDDAKSFTYRRGKKDPGMGQVTLARKDPLAASAVFPRQLLFYDRDILRARALIEATPHNTVSEQEESGEDVTVGGPGPLALTARGRVDPLGLTLKPKQSSIRFSYAHPDYDDTVDGWEAAVDVGDFDRPPDWPGGGTNIWGPSGDNTFAPGGTVYFRGPDWTNPTEQVLEYVWTVDNYGELQLDGQDIDSLNVLDNQNYNRSHSRRYLTSAGSHMCAAHAFNQSSAEPGPSGNPGSIRLCVWTLDANGERDSIIHSTSTSWKAYEFPQERPPELQRPGWTAGQIADWFLDRWEAESGVVVTRSFGAFVDTDAVTWPNILDFTAPVGPLFDAFQALAEIHCDLDWDPGSDELHAWLKDTRGSDLSATRSLPSGYTDSVNGCLVNLSHQVEPPICTSALVEWRDGFVLVENEAAPVYVGRKIDAPEVNTDAAAERIGTDAVAVFGTERVQGRAQLHPRDDTQRPGVGFDVADTVDAPDRTLALVPQTIQSYTVTVDADGEPRFQVEFGDSIFDQQERFANWLKGIQNGSLGGRTFQVTPYRQEVFAESTARKRTVIPFHHNASDATGESDPITVDDHGTIQAFTVDIPGEEGGTFAVNVNGSPVDSVTVSASVGSYTERGWDYKVQPGDQLTIDSAAAIAYVATVRIA